MTSLAERVGAGVRAVRATPRSAQAEGLAALARRTLGRATDWLVADQDDAGWWKGELATNVTMEAEDLLMREFLGIRTAEETVATARWIRAAQQADGGWNTWHGGPSDLSTTVECWVALRLAGDADDAPHLQAAATWVRAHGGLERARVFTHIWLALSGLWSWADVPVIPPEIVLLPPTAPLALPSWGCWARQTIVPLSIVSALRPVRALAIDTTPLRTGAGPKPGGRPWTVAGAFSRLDRLLHRYHEHPIGPIRRLALRRAAEWVVARQEADGSWGGIQPPWVYSILALHLLGYALDHPVLAAGLAGLDRFTVVEDTPAGPVRRLEACQSPVWDTALALVALGDAGAVEGETTTARAARRGVDWMLAEEITVVGDWAVRRPGLAPGGWAFEFDNDIYPDVDDTAEVVLALRRALPAPGRPGFDVDRQVAVDAAVERAVAWTLGMQSADGGWGAFDADQSYSLNTRLPFCDFGEVVDPPSADVTAHVVEMLAHEGLGGSDAVARGVGWLLANQEPGGSWFGRWGVNHVYGTGAVVPALVAAGLDPGHVAVRRAVRWLLAVQQPDGGWGEDIRSYADPAWIGRGPTTASQTAWALLALQAAGHGHGVQAEDDAVRRGIGWLVRRQRVDGGWDEPEYTGTGFPTDFSINYGLYRQVFPVSALGRWLAGGAPAGPDTRPAAIDLAERAIDLASVPVDLVGPADDGRLTR